MSLGALDLLALTKPKENAGVRSGNRFLYQWNWSLKKLLELEEHKQDHVMIFDYHDDLIVCDSEKDDANIDFYQIKTRPESNWTRNLLLKPGTDSTDDGEAKSNEIPKQKSVGLCILAKLMDHSTVFDKNARDFYFVTDSKLSFFTKNVEQVAFADLKGKDQEAIKVAIRRDVPTVTDTAFDHLFFIPDQMKVKDFRTLMIGTVSVFLNNNLKDVEVNPNTLYVNLIKSIEAKSTYEQEISCRQDIIKHKAITHSDFKDYLSELITIKNYDLIQSNIVNVLPQIGVNFATRSKIKDSLSKIKGDLKDYENSTIRRLISLIRQEFLSYQAKETDANNEWEYAEIIYQKVLRDNEEKNDFSKEYILALILYLFYDEEQ